MLEVTGLRKSWPDFRLALDLSLGDGQIGVVLGPSGCGKSTLLRILAGLVSPDGGSIRLNGTSLERLAPERRGLGMVFQDLALFPHLSVRRNIDYGLRMQRLPRPRRAKIVGELARSFGIEALLDRSPSSLSGGERQRTALARTLAPSPGLVLLDEPLSSLDLELRRRLRTEIADRLRAAGVMALHVTHDVDEAFAMADLVYLMGDGRIRERGSAEELYERPRSAFTARFLGRGPVLEATRLEVGDRLLRVRTALGVFSCPRPRDDAVRTGSGEALFFPSDAARILSLDEASHDTGPNGFDAVLVESVFSGRYRRVVVDAHPRGSSSGLTRLELEFAASLRLEAGSVLRLRVPEERCILVPEAGEEEEMA